MNRRPSPSRSRPLDQMLHLRAMGIPRRINRLADLALMVGYAEEAPRVEARHIESVHQELTAAA